MIGLGSYAFFWAHKGGLSLEDALQKTHDLGVGLFQICDFAPIELLSVDELRAVKRRADDLGISPRVGYSRPRHRPPASVPLHRDASWA